MSASISLNDAAAARAWFTNVIEPLADSFHPDDVERYVELFSQVLERADPDFGAAELIARFQRVRLPLRYSGPDPDDVVVLSRVTLGADIAITSVMLDAAKRRFPKARIWFTGSRKGHELFGADPRIGHIAAPYDRTGSLRDRIAASRSLAGLIAGSGVLVIDPDSRLTQLGLVPVCDESRYLFFESRSCTEMGTLTGLARRWAERVLGVEDAKSYMAPPPADAAPVEITLSLGVGENPAKRVPDPFERELMQALAARTRTLLVDQGPGGEETARVHLATRELPNVRLFEGSFAQFSARIAASGLYVGYDSAGQHAAAALGIPLVAVFAGYPNCRFVERWSPSGAGQRNVVLAEDREPQALVRSVLAVLD